jgi:hypothetical protein
LAPALASSPLAPLVSALIATLLTGPKIGPVSFGMREDRPRAMAFWFPFGFASNHLLIVRRGLHLVICHARIHDAFT